MAKETCPLCRGKKGTNESWGTHGKGWYPCSKCKGKGFIIVADPPREKKEPTKREPRPERQQTQRTEPQYRPQQTQRTQQPDRPQQTSQWLEKSCGRPNCRNSIRYLPTWDHIPNFCKDCKAEMKRLNQSFETHDRNYVMPGMGETIGQMGGIWGKHYPRQGTIHCSVFDGMGSNDIHTSWNYNVIKEEVTELHARTNSLKG